MTDEQKFERIRELFVLLRWSERASMLVELGLITSLPRLSLSQAQEIAALLDCRRCGRLDEMLATVEWRVKMCSPRVVAADIRKGFGLNPIDD